MKNRTHRNLIPGALALALLGLIGVLGLAACNQPVDLAPATDQATFQRGVAANSRPAGSTPAVVINARGTAAPLSVQLNGTEVASIDRTGALAAASGSISAGEIANVTRYVNIPLNGFVECQTDAGALIGFDTTADALPDFVNSATDGTGFTLRFDDTGSSEDQSSEVCSQLLVPATYASGGAFQIRALKDAHTGATEIINCGVSVNGAALQTAGTVTTSTASSTAYTCTPTISSLAADDSLAFYLSITSSGTMNDIVDIAAVAFSFVATQ